MCPGRRRARHTARHRDRGKIRADLRQTGFVRDGSLASDGWLEVVRCVLTKKRFGCFGKQSDTYRVDENLRVSIQDLVCRSLGRDADGRLAGSLLIHDRSKVFCAAFGLEE